MTQHQTATTSTPASDATVEIKVPAQGAYVAVLRTTTAALAARLEFTIDDVEDLRIAVGEAASMALGHAVPGSTLRCTFQIQEQQVDVRVSVAAVPDTFPEFDSFTWTVLSTLASEASVRTDDGEFSVLLTMVSSLAGADG